MQTETAILVPAAVLAGWTMIVFIWLLARRVPAFSAAGVKLGEMPAGTRGVDGEAQMPAKANWISHNYTHLMEQPTVFYPVVIILALLGDNSSLSVNLAWAYTGCAWCTVSGKPTSIRFPSGSRSLASQVCA